MVEGLVGQIEQLRGMLLGQHVDRDPELLAACCHLDLVWGVSVPPSAFRSTTRPASTPYLANGMPILHRWSRVDRRSMTQIRHAACIAPAG